jgi:hypothetical protein
MAERKTYDQINSIYLASPAMTTSIAQHAAIGRLEGREKVDAIFNLEQSVSTRQEEYLLENQIKIIEFTVNNNAVLYRVTDIDDQVYSLEVIQNCVHLSGRKSKIKKFCCDHLGDIIYHKGFFKNVSRTILREHIQTFKT